MSVGHFSFIRTSILITFAFCFPVQWRSGRTIRWTARDGRRCGRRRRWRRRWRIPSLWSTGLGDWGCKTPDGRWGGAATPVGVGHVTWRSRTRRNEKQIGRHETTTGVAKVQGSCKVSVHSSQSTKTFIHTLPHISGFYRNPVWTVLWAAKFNTNRVQRRDEINHTDSCNVWAFWNLIGNCPKRWIRIELSYVFYWISLFMFCSCREEDKKSVPETSKHAKPSTDLLDLVDINFGNPTLPQQPPPPQRTAASTVDPWGMPVAAAAAAAPAPADNDPWGGAQQPPQQQQPEQPPPLQNDPWAVIQPPPPPQSAAKSASPAFGGGGAAAASSSSSAFGAAPPTCKLQPLFGKNRALYCIRNKQLSALFFSERRKFKKLSSSFHPVCFACKRFLSNGTIQSVAFRWTFDTKRNSWNIDWNGSPEFKVAAPAVRFHWEYFIWKSGRNFGFLFKFRCAVPMGRRWQLCITLVYLINDHGRKIFFSPKIAMVTPY